MLNRPATRILMTGLLATSALAGQAGAATYSDAVLADNPDFYWNMEVTGGTVDNLGSQGNAVGNQLQNLNGGVVFNAGTTNNGGLSLGNTADFDGTTRLFSNAGLTGGQFDQYVIEFWINTSATGSQYVMWHGAPGAAVISGYNPNLEFYTAGGQRTGADGPDLADGAWHHVVAGIDSTAGHTIYVDGALHSSQTETLGAWQDAAGMNIGGSNLGDHFTGQIDEFAVYNTDSANLAALTAQVATHYNAVPEPGSMALLALGGLAMLRRRRA